MRITYPVFKPSITKTRRPIIYAFELFYHTILPCAVTYIAIRNDNPLLLAFLLLPLFVRFRPEDLEVK